MNRHDDELDRLFRAARPADVRSDRPLGAPEIALRENIIRGAVRAPKRRARPRIIWAGVTAAVATLAVAVLVTLSVLSPAQQAIALTPPPLPYSTAGSMSDVVIDAERALSASSGPEQASHVESVVWGWSAEIEQQRIESVPQEITFDWGEGETATTTIVAADSYWPEGDRPPGVEPSPYRPGEIIDEVKTAPEDFDAPAELTSLTGDSREELFAALGAFGVSESSSSGELLAAIDGLMQYWTLSNAQHAELLEILIDADDVEVLGATRDRLGRDVIGLQVSSTIPERTDTVFISRDTGRLVGVESELIEPRDGLPAGVISYAMWEAAH
ncbi:MAG: hypothetical protein K0Q52_388 [Microbacterium sp.]|nr:hypothetical protein [Microbacterium sp.]